MATKANLTVDQGASFSTTTTLTDTDGNPIDLTNYNAAAQMRKTYTSSTSTAFSVYLGGVDGTVVLSLSANTTANVAAGRYVYDVELTDNTGLVSRVFEGIVTVNPNVTR